MSSTRSWAALALLCAPVLLMSIDLTVLAVAIPHLSADLRPSAAQLLWIIDIYGLFLAGLLIVMGTLADRIGPRRLLLIGAVLFGLASVLAAVADTAAALILARALLGIGGATLMPSTLSLIRSIFTDALARRRAIAVWAAAFAGGAGLGPVIGGALLEQFEWGAVFLINVPVMIVLLAAGPFVLPESRTRRQGRFEIVSAVMLIAALLIFVFGLKHASEHGWDATTLISCAAGLGIGVLFTIRQRNLQHPLIDVSLFGSASFSAAVLANAAGIFALVSVLYFFPQYIQLVLGRSPLTAGLWALPIAIGAIAGAVLAPVLARRVRIGWLIGSGLVVAAGGYCVLAALGIEEAPLIAFTGGALIGAGVGLADTLTNDVIIAAAPPHRAAAAAGISETAYELGGALGIAVLGSLGTSLYRHGVEAHAGALPAQAAPAIDAAMQTLSAAHEAVAELPASLAERVIILVNSAFTEAMTDTFALGGAALAVTGVAVGAALRTHQAAGSDEGGAGDGDGNGEPRAPRDGDGEPRPSGEGDSEPRPSGEGDSEPRSRQDESGKE